MLFFADFTDYAAKIDGYGIERTVLNEAVEEKMVFYRQAEQDVDEAVLQKDVLNQMVDKQIIETYAQENDIYVADEKLQTYYVSRVNSAESEEILLADLKRMYGIDKTEYLSNLSYDLLRQAVQEHTGQPLGEWLETERNNSKIIIKL